MSTMREIKMNGERITTLMPEDDMLAMVQNVTREFADEWQVVEVIDLDSGKIIFTETNPDI